MTPTSKHLTRLCDWLDIMADLMPEAVTLGMHPTTAKELGLTTDMPLLHRGKTYTIIVSPYFPPEDEKAFLLNL